MPMKRSAINEEKEKFQKLTEAAKEKVLSLLDCDKNNVYALQEILKTVTKDFYQQGPTMGFSKEKVRHAIIKATMNLVYEKKIVEDRIGHDDYYGSK